MATHAVDWEKATSPVRDTTASPLPSARQQQHHHHHHQHHGHHNHKSKARFQSAKLSTAWTKIRQHLHNPSHPSTSSEDDSFQTDGYYVDSMLDDHIPGTRITPSQLLKPAGPSTGILKRKGKKKSAKGSQAKSESRFGDDETDAGGSKYCEPLSHIVVDNNFDHFQPGVARSDGGSTNKNTGTGISGPSNVIASTTVQTGDTRSSKGEGETGDDGDASSMHVNSAGRRWAMVRNNVVVEWIVDRLWPNMVHFLDSRFPEEKKERSYQRETWFGYKQVAQAAALFLVISWVLTVSLLPQPLTNFAYGTYLAAAGFFTIPLIPLIIFDYPRFHNFIWQFFLLGAVWVLPDILVIEMNVCGFFSFDNRCGTRNFMNLFGFAYGSPVLAIFALRQHRLAAVLGAVQWMVLVGVLLMTEDNYPTLFYRNIVNFCLFQALIILASFLKERSDRQMFALRSQLKIQYRATQAAQVMEKRASDSKKRFVSYIFHEVRVPLNTALLAVQNLDGEEVFKGLQEDQAEMVHGLMGSLTMMEKVLNDVLSFNRMESGKFTQARKPFDFHKSIQLVALSHRMQAQMAGIDLEVELDKDIEKIGGMFMGDEMRLRQVTSNLVSNSIKFTEQGGVKIVTKLLYPRLEPTPAVEIDDPLRQAAINSAKQQQLADEQAVITRPGLNRRIHTSTSVKFSETASQAVASAAATTHDPEKGSIAMEEERMHPSLTARPATPRAGAHGADREIRHKAVVRVEIHDTGVGLRKQDVIDNRLFSPYVQTEIGRRQGGKGSGLGLALVRQIVKLSNGRLGVESQYGRGSMFWFELPYYLPRQNKEAPSRDDMGGGIDKKWASAPGTPDPRATISVLEKGTGPQLGPHDLGVDPTMLGRPPLTTRHSTIGDVPMEELVVTSYPPMSGSTRSTPFSPMERGESIVGLASSAPLQQDPSQDSSSAGSPLGPLPSFGDPFSSARPPALSPPLAEHPGGASGIPTDPSGERRESGWSGKTKVDPRGSVGDHTMAAGRSPTAAAPVRRDVTTSSDPPLCTLVVDDDKLTRMLMSRMLTRLGHQVQTAENGKVALDMLTASYRRREGSVAYDVVFLDNQMPLMSGVEVATEVRKMGCPIYIVGCTGNALREDQEEYLNAGADGIIPKPIHQKAILEQIKEARRRIAGETSPKGITEDMEDPMDARGADPFRF